MLIEDRGDRAKLNICKICNNDPVEAERYDFCKRCWWDQDPRNSGSIRKEINMETYLYRIKGIVKDVAGVELSQTFYYETTGFPKAVTKAKKLLDHIHEIVQVHGQLIDEDE